MARGDEEETRMHVASIIDLMQVLVHDTHHTHTTTQHNPPTPPTPMSKHASTPKEGDGSLNQFFKDLSLEDFPKPPLGKILELPSDMPIASACRTLSEHNFLAAPVRDVKVPDSESWVDKYIGE